MKYKVIRKTGKEENEMTFNSIEEAENTFIQSVLEEMNAVYLQFNQLNVVSLGKHKQRISGLADSILRFKLKEIKKASFEFRESTFILKEN